MEFPTIRLLISPCRSGSTALMHSISQSRHVHAMYQPIKTGVREKRCPDQSIFDGTHRTFSEYKSPIFLIKETLGHANVHECCFEVFSSSENISLSKPLFLFRDPIATWNSWKKLGFADQNGIGISDLNLFLKAYFYTYQMFLTAQMQSSEVTCITREQLLSQPQQLLSMICQRWDIPFSNNMIYWDTTFDNNDNFFCAESERKTFPKIMKVLQSSSGLNYTESDRNMYQSLVTEEEKEEIEVALNPLYAKILELSEVYYPILAERDLAGVAI